MYPINYKSIIMKKLIIGYKHLCLCFLLIVSGCKGDGGDILDIFIPNISNVWKSSRNTRFFFNPDKSGVNETTFSGSEQNGTTEDLTGKFKNYDVEFTFINGDEEGVKYTGKFIKGSNPLRLEVKGTNNVNLVIIQDLSNNP